MDADKIIRRFNALESLRGPWEGIWQQCADYVLPRLGQHSKKNNHIFDSTAPLALDRFSAAFASSLTPRTVPWHGLVTGNEALDRRQDVRRYLEEVTAILFRARYRPGANFDNQIQEVYESLGVHGTGVLLIEDDLGRGLRYTCIPVYQVYLAANAAGQPDTVFRLYKLTARQAAEEFGDALPDRIKRDAEDPVRMDNEFEFIHGVFPRWHHERDRAGSRNLPYVSVHVARQCRAVVREGGYRTMPYAVSRFKVDPGEVYGRSPAMMVMSNIIMANEIKKSLLRAAQKMVDPPLLTPEQDMLEAYNLKAGAINYGGVNADGKQMILPLQIDGNLPVGLEMLESERRVINDAFYITLFQILVEQGGQQTATEVIQRAQEKAQIMAPPIGRQQSELLRPIIERELDIISAAGSLEGIEVPEVFRTLGGAAVEPKYETTINKTLNAGSGVSILQAIEGLAPLAAIHSSVYDVIEPMSAARVVCESFGVPALVMRTEEEAAALDQQRQQEQESMMAMQMGQAAMQGLESVSNAEKNLQQAQAMAQGAPQSMMVQ